MFNLPVSGRKAVRQYSTKIITILVLVILAGGCATVQKKPPVPPPARPEARKEITKTALSLRGRPYKKTAKGPDAFDCSGFVQYVYKKAKITLPPSTADQSRIGQKIALNDVSPGDLVFFRSFKVFHVGIMLNKKEFIHSSTTKGVSVDRIDDDYWKKKKAYFRRVL
jgi:cell wall-associated NlpC family hydrolase